MAARIPTIIGLASLLLAGALASLFTNSSFPSSPDERAALFYSEHFRATGSLVWHSKINAEYNTTIFSPRLSSPLGDNAYAAPYPWFSTILATFSIFVPASTFMAATGLAVALTAFSLARRLGAGGWSAAAPPLLLFSTGFFFFSGRAYSNVASLALILSSLFSLVVRPGRAGTACAWLLLGAAVLVRLDAILAVIPFALLMDLGVVWPLRLKRAASAAAIGLGILLLAFFLPRLVAAQDPPDRIVETIGGVVGRPAEYWFAIRTFLIPSLFAVPVVGLLAKARLKTRGPRDSFLWAAVATTLLFVLAFGARTGTFHYATGEPDASMFRYFMLPVTMLTIAVVAAANHAFGASRRISAVAAAAIVVPALLVPVSEVGAFTDREEARMEAIRRNYEGINQLNSSWVFFTKTQDKYLTNRDLAVGIYRTEADLAAEPDLKAFFRPTDVRGELVPLVDELLKDGWNVLVSPDAGDLVAALQGEGYKTPRFAGGSGTYQIRPAA